jgi:hypothetical protein
MRCSIVCFARFDDAIHNLPRRLCDVAGMFKVENKVVKVHGSNASASKPSQLYEDSFAYYNGDRM